MRMLVSAWIGVARAWTPGELRPLDLGAVGSLAASGAWDGAPAVFVASADGVRVFDPFTGVALGSLAELAGAELLVHDLDGQGEPEVLSCAEAGVALLRGQRGTLGSVRRLADGRCDRLVVEVYPDWPRLVSASAGVLVRWNPTSLGLEREEIGDVAAEPVLAASGAAVATVRADGTAWTSSGGPVVLPGPVVAVVGLPPAEGQPAWAWLVGGDSRRLVGPDGAEIPIDGGASGIVARAGRIWVLDADGGRVGTVSAGAIGWWPVPVPPRFATAFDADTDGCPDLVLADGLEGGALVLGRCEAAELPPPARPAVAAPVVVPSVPARLAVDDDRWKVVDVRVGDVLRTRIAIAEGWTGRWRSRGGPPAFRVERDGAVEWTPTVADIGRWRVSLRTTAPDRLTPRWTGFELRVWPADGTVAGPVVPDHAVDAPQYPDPPPAVRALVPRSVLAGFGWTGGAADAGGTTWQNLGQADVRGGTSPMAALVGVWGDDLLRVVGGVDSAPFFSYGSQPQDRRHGIAGLLGVQAGGSAAIGPYATIGSSIRGAGLRFQWTGLDDGRDRPMGLELRALWLAPQIGAAGSVLWLWTL